MLPAAGRAIIDATLHPGSDLLQMQPSSSIVLREHHVGFGEAGLQQRSA